ncbi:hypothetical protein LPY66_18145 [Dehalobacter sp. DCM]|uniref:hypothetical protein n=1 Tax=Dehalobacter sp. DCM TaxID=2907827 RepID=UPI0030821E10|nr:hypothetical protein LPY66_18145 [Dehalobacter sp. DCM]
MQTVSTQFMTAIAAASRQTTAKVLFHLVDVDAAPDATITVTGEASISKKEQLTNSLTDMTAKLATLENDYWSLDGSFVLPPESTETGYEVGWWSSELSGVGGAFSTPQVLTLQFSKDHSVIGFSIYFDVLADEYASDFTIVAYDSLNAVIDTQTITGNTTAKYIIEHTISNFRKVVITITKWKSANRRARVAEVGLGVIYEYDGDTLIKANILEELDPVNTEVTGNEIKFTIENADKRFNLLNPTGVYPALQKLQKVFPYLGVITGGTSSEYAQMGVYYLDEWQSDEGALTATFTAHDLLYVLAQSEYAGDTYVTETLYNIAVEILTAAGLAADYYEVDTALQSITTSGSLAKMNYREALQNIAIAGMAALYCNRQGKIIIKQLGSLSLTETIDFDNMYSSPKISLDKLVNTIKITSGESTYTYTDPLKDSDDQVVTIEIENTVISDATMAQNVSIWVLAELKKRFLYEINWRMNPAYEVGDILTIEDDFSEDKTARLTKQEFTYEGYLAGKTNARGAGT